MQLPPAKPQYDQTNENESRFLTTLALNGLEARVEVLESVVTTPAPPPTPGTGPTAAYTYDKLGRSVTFTDESFDVAPGLVVSWLWDFGDNVTTGIRNPTHVYAADGTYTVTLQVTDNSGLVNSLGKTVKVAALGIPFILAGLYNGDTSINANTAPFSGGLDFVSTQNLIARLADAKARGLKIITAMTGGAHCLNYAARCPPSNTAADKFDFPTWKQRMDAFNTPTLIAAVKTAVEEGTLLGNYVIDEPNHDDLTGAGPDWGHVMTKALVDQMCAYAKGIFPTLPEGVATTHTWRMNETFAVADFMMPMWEYDQNFGTLTAWRDAVASEATRQRMRAIYTINVLDGGDRLVPCTWGPGTFGPNCWMSPTQIQDAINTLGAASASAGCALWRQDANNLASANFQPIYAAGRTTLDAVPARSLRRF